MLFADQALEFNGSVINPTQVSYTQHSVYKFEVYGVELLLYRTMKDYQCIKERITKR